MKSFRAYILCVIMCVCASGVAAGFFTADVNAKRISLGKTEAEVAVFYSSGSAAIGTDEVKISIGEREKETAKKLCAVLPPPVCNIYWFYQGMESLIGKTSIAYPS